MKGTSSVMSSTPGNTTDSSNDMYYTFSSPKVQRSLHVVDADYGAFEQSTPNTKTINLRIRTPKFIRKLKDKTNYETERVVLDNSDALNLRAEPEIFNSNNYVTSKKKPKAKFVSIPQIFNDSEDETFDDTLSLSSSSSANNDYTYQPLPDLKNVSYDRSQDGRRSIFKNPNNSGISLTTSQKQSMAFKKNAAASTTPSMQSKMNVDPNYKSRIEEEYELLKLKAARYQTERDLLKIKVQHQKMASKLREYEYFCVNGIDHKTIEADSTAIATYKTATPEFRMTESEYLHYQQQQQQMQRNPQSGRSKQRSKQRSTLRRQGMETNFLDKLSTNIPPGIMEYLDYYSDYVPSTQTIKEYHLAVLGWVYTIPFLSIIYPVLKLIGLIIPNQSKRSWSVRALLVGFLDSVILLMTGWVVYNFFRFAMAFVVNFLKVARFLGIA